MSLLLHLDCDGLENAARDLSDAAAFTAQVRLDDGLYHGAASGPQSVQAALHLLRQRAEEAHSVVASLSGETEHTAEKLVTCSRGFRSAEDLCTIPGR